jgi:hypothetical protein
MIQNSDKAIENIEKLENFLNGDHQNIVISIQKITETFQLNQDNSKDNQSLLREILKEIGGASRTSLPVYGAVCLFMKRG